MINSIHFLLTYQCTSECDHCFLHCSPRAEGTFTISQVQAALSEIGKIRSINSVYFEGGEPFLYYPLLLESVRRARKQGFSVGIVTNSYWAKGLEDALIWLEPLAKLGIEDLSLSDDDFHFEDVSRSPSKIARAAAEKLGIPSMTICIEPATIEESAVDSNAKGEPVVGGGVMFRGRAVEKLAAGLPVKPWQALNSCPHEELASPERVHVDAFGHVHLCQGLLLGNMWQTPLAELLARYDPLRHPICAPLISGGPAKLASEYGIPTAEGYIDECHLCYLTRRALIERFPEYLAPRQVYGLSQPG